MEGGLVVSVAWAVVGILGVSFLYSILMHILKSYQRTDKLPESFPFQNTIRTALSRHTILDFILHSQNELKDKESGCLNLYGLPWMVFTRNIDNITHVLKEIDTFGKGPLWIERFSGLLGQGIFNSDGEIWYKHRKVSANLFKLSSFKNEILDTFHAHSLELIDVLKGKQPGSQIDIQGLMFNFTLESIGKIAFGIKFNALRQKRSLLPHTHSLPVYLLLPLPLFLSLASGSPIISIIVKPTLMSLSWIPSGCCGDTSPPVAGSSSGSQEATLSLLL
jgi:hypothetical protein